MTKQNKSKKNTSLKELKNQIKKHPELIGKKSVFWLSASSKFDIYFKHKHILPYRDCLHNTLCKRRII